MPPVPRKIIIADDHPLFRAALHKCLTQFFGEIEIVEAGDLQGLQQLLGDHADADLLLFDLYMPGTKGFSGLNVVNTRYPQLPVVVISADEKPATIRDAVSHGAAGFLPKSAPASVIADALARVLAGEIWLPDTAQGDEPVTEHSALASLTPQQYRVAQMLVSGLQNKQIAAALQVSEATIKAHLTTIFRKLGVSSRTQAVLALQSMNVTAQ